VTIENCPGEVFINVSPTKCWSMIRERLNMEIRKQLSMGRANLPTLQPPGSVDGLEMFGLLSPVIVKVRKSQTHLVLRNEKETLKHTNIMRNENLFQGCIILRW
jgi:hypothetical protein